MVAVVEKPESTTSREFEIDQNIEVLIGDVLERSGSGGNESKSEILKEIQQLMLDRVQLLTPTIARFTFRKAG